MTRLRIALALLACLAVAAFAAGCGSSNDDSSSSSSSAPAAADTSSTESTSSSAATSSGGTVDVKMQNIAFAPKDVTAKVGQTVKWTNDDTVDHDVTAKSGATFKSDLFGKDGTFTAKVTKPGTITYVCTVHPGMEGTITVVK